MNKCMLAVIQIEILLQEIAYHVTLKQEETIGHVNVMDLDRESKRRRKSVSFLS